LSLVDDLLRYYGLKKFDGYGNELPEADWTEKLFVFRIADIAFIFNRLYLYADIACEIFLNSRRSYLFNFADTKTRTQFYRALGAPKPIPRPPEWEFFTKLRRATGSFSQNCGSADLFQKSKATKRWKHRWISNFEYLFYLNIVSGRSFNDVTQYPVYPWVLSDYESEWLNLSDERVFRDLSLPIGALNESRLEQDLAMMEELDTPEEMCIQRFHYLNAATVLGYEIRDEPFATLHIVLQSGRFDRADRLFNSIPAAWQSVTGRARDYRELIPEFFASSGFLDNANEFDLGVLQSGEKCGDCKLPKWAKNSFEFTQINLQALESEHARSRIHDWIDLIFGCFQRSVQKHNMFHMYCYPDCYQEIKDEAAKELARDYCVNFGSCPVKLFAKPHPRVLAPEPSLEHIDNISLSQLVFLDKLVCFDDRGDVYNLRNSLRSHISVPKTEFSEILYLTKTDQFAFLHKHGGFVTISTGQFLTQDGSLIKCMAEVNNELLLTAGGDCLVYIWKPPEFDLIGRIPVTSSEIISIAGNYVLGLVACVSVTHKVFVCDLAEMRNLFSLDIDSPPEATHRISLLTNGLIAVTVELQSPDTFTMLFITLRGKEIGKITGEGTIAKIIPLTTKSAETYVIISTVQRDVIIVNGTTCTVDNLLPIHPIPGLVTTFDDTRKLLMHQGDGGKFSVLIF
jgi:hypothetical protein